MSELPQETRSGRQVKRTGMNESKKSALQKIKEAREGGIKRTDQYEVSWLDLGAMKILNSDINVLTFLTGDGKTRRVRRTWPRRVRRKADGA